MNYYKSSILPITLLNVAFVFFLSFFPVIAHAEPANQGGAGDLLVAPTRVVLEGRTRAADVVLNNKGDKETTYRISLVRMRMDDTGNYKTLKDGDTIISGEQAASDLLRFSPKQVTLKAGESQTVKIMLRKPDGLKEGEYRSHLLVQAIPDAAFGTDVEATETSKNDITVKLIPQFGVSIPVIVREGTLSAEAKLSDMNIKEGLSFTIHRTGTRSLFGDVAVMQGDKIVGELRGIAVFVPNTKRHITVALTQKTPGSPLRIIYREREEDGGRIIAETQFTP